MGELLRKARKDAGLTHLELSERSGIRKGVLLRAENGGHWSKSSVEGILGVLPPSSELATLVRVWEQFSIKGSIKKLSRSPEFRDRFPDLLRKARENAGLSIRELARRAGIDAAYLSKMERKLVPAPKWPKIAAIAGHLPLSELAKQAEVSGKEKLKNSVLEQVGDVEKLIVSLPGAAFDDPVWVSAVQARLHKCMIIVKASEHASGSEFAFVGKERAGGP
jgi:transcriptional regulator with XRE-family HTH domain